MKKKLLQVFIGVLAVGSIATAVISSYQIYRQLKDVEKFDEIRTIAAADPEDKKSGIDFGKLEEINPDIVAWMQVENTDELSFPILQAKDNQFYLTHAYDKSESQFGSAFMDAESPSDFSGYNTFIYGHNIAGSDELFSFLENYEDYDYYVRHPTIKILTEDKEYTARIVSFNIDTWDSFLYQPYIDTQEALDTYLDYALEHSLYSANISASPGSRYVTFYTCAYRRVDRSNIYIDRYYLTAVLEEILG